MAKWLYNSDGDPIGFIDGDNVFSLRGSFVGTLNSDQQVWNGDYVGELFADDRLVFDATKLHGRRPLPTTPALPRFMGEPPYRDAVTIPRGYHDVDLK